MTRFGTNLVLMITMGCLAIVTVQAENLEFGKKDQRMTTISRGEPVELMDWLVRGKVTVFDFYSKSCPPCRAIKGPLQKTIGMDESVALRVVDIDRPGAQGIDWASPVAKQYRLNNIPHFIIYDATGKVWAEGDQARDKLVGWMQEKGNWGAH